MSKVLRSFPRDTRQHNNGYDWDKWLDGRIHQLTKGRDYTVSSNSMRSAAYTAARRNGGRIRSHVEPTRIIIQFYED